MIPNLIIPQKLWCIRMAAIAIAAISILMTSAAIGSDHLRIHKKDNPGNLREIASTSNNINRYKVTNSFYLVPSLSFISNTGQHAQIDELLALPRPVMLQFIYTTCTTICPVLSATFAQAQDQLSKISENFLLISISIDPEHDNVQKISDYAKRHNAGRNWIFLTGGNDDTRHLLKAFDVLYPGSNKMNHRSSIFLRAHPNTSWRRIDGFLSADELIAEFAGLATPVRASH